MSQIYNDLLSYVLEHGDNYIAYTFYLKNTGDADLDYQTVMNVTGTSKSVDEAVRVMVYKNGQEQTFAKGQFNNREQPETDATKWVDETHCRFTLRDDVTMYDGTPLVADDVVYSVGVWTSRSANNDTGMYISGAEKEDDHTVVSQYD